MTTSLPTEARLKQKQRIKEDKAKGIKPKKRAQKIEFGNDDCGDDITGLGKNITLLAADIPIERYDEDDNDNDQPKCK